jgi:hypothetical protein
MPLQKELIAEYRSKMILYQDIGLSLRSTLAQRMRLRISRGQIGVNPRIE